MIKSFPGFTHPGERPVHRLPVVRLQHRESHHFARPVLEQLADRYEVAETFRHLLAFDLQKPVMHPVVRHNIGVECTTRLRDFVLVMRKYKIDAAAMNIEGLAQMLPRHCGTFDVPPWAARCLYTRRRWPGRFALL